MLRVTKKSSQNYHSSFMFGLGEHADGCAEATLNMLFPRLNDNTIAYYKRAYANFMPSMLRMFIKGITVSTNFGYVKAKPELAKRLSYSNYESYKKSFGPGCESCYNEVVPCSNCSKLISQAIKRNPRGPKPVVSVNQWDLYWVEENVPDRNDVYLQLGVRSFGEFPEIDPDHNIFSRVVRLHKNQKQTFKWMCKPKTSIPISNGDLDSLLDLSNSVNGLKSMRLFFGPHIPSYSDLPLITDKDRLIIFDVSMTCYTYATYTFCGRHFTPEM